MAKASASANTNNVHSLPKLRTKLKQIDYNTAAAWYALTDKKSYVEEICEAFVNRHSEDDISRVFNCASSVIQKIRVLNGHATRGPFIGLHPYIRAFDLVTNIDEDIRPEILLHPENAIKYRTHGAKGVNKYAPTEKEKQARAVTTVKDDDEPLFDKAPVVAKITTRAAVAPQTAKERFNANLKAASVPLQEFFAHHKNPLAKITVETEAGLVFEVANL